MSRTVPSPERAGLLVIGYGNELRCDDGVGARVAAAAAGQNLDGVRVIVAHQLTPEMAEPIASARRVVFVDAAADSSDVRVREISPPDSAGIMTHAANPGSLLALAKALFGACPKAFWLTIPAENFSFGDEFSPRTKMGFETALEIIKAIAACQEMPSVRQ